MILPELFGLPPQVADLQFQLVDPALEVTGFVRHLCNHDAPGRPRSSVIHRHPDAAETVRIRIDA
ncbi:MAG: hypothetical protein H6523_07230 [Mycolicibacterium sp.]|uniref:hypothetical protein n=1 Tax=Mycolicibacterium insubricum TaxID=444597 RepID=UPI0009F6F0E9|nr:hypothetical protein [Mycolicibacterium insubricum]MCB9440025.1 hypothetical protein [Mycolicibacterium sp.]